MDERILPFVGDYLDAMGYAFVEGARKNGVPARIVDQIFEQFEPFARYGFNRAHAACYGLIAYYTAYLKARYSAEYMTAVLSSTAGEMERVAQAVAECQRMGLEILPPDVNASHASFTVVEGAIRFGLAAIRNVGVGAVEVIIAARESGGAFSSLADLCARVDTRQVNQRVLASLVKAGACDSLGATRAQMLQTLDETVEQAQRSQRARVQGQTGLFDLGSAVAPAARDDGAPQEFSPEERLTMEREMLGLYISDHPLRRWQPVLESKVTATLAQLPELRDRQDVLVGGLVGSVKRSITRAGSAMAFLTLEDLTGSVEVLVFPRAYEQHGLALKRDTVVLLRGRLDIEEQGVKLLCDEVIPLPGTPEEAVTFEVPPRAPRQGRGPGRASANGSGSGAARAGATATAVRPAPPEPAAAVHARALRVRVTTREEIEQLCEYLAAHPGDRPVCAHVVTDGGEHIIPVQSRLGDDEDLQQELEQLFGEGNVWEE